MGIVNGRHEVDPQWESCCRGRKSCPQIKQVEEVFLIKDDDGNVIKLTADQLKDVMEYVNSQYVL